MVEVDHLPMDGVASWNYCKAKQCQAQAQKEVLNSEAHSEHIAV